MPRHRSILPALVAMAALAGPVASAAAHGTNGRGQPYAGKGALAGLATPQQAAFAAALPDTSQRLQDTPAPAGPCTEAAKASMPVDQPHKHDDIAAHRFSCRIEQVAFLSLKEQLADRPDVILGEMDVQADIAAVAVTMPRAGVLFFDVKDPARPRFLSRYDGTECDQLLLDINCGAFVDLAEDGKTAYLSLQKLTYLPGQVSPNVARQSLPGVDVIDLGDPARPTLTQSYPIAGIGGVHTVRSHTIPPGPSSAERPRAPGEYVISNQNGVGIDIAKVSRIGGKRVLQHVTQVEGDSVLATIENNEVHDTFIQNDPLDGRTYLYNAAGFSTGFTVYDITDPQRVRLVAEWDLTPECTEDWYAHTIDVTHRGGRRYVTMPAELFLQKDRESPSGLAEMSDQEKAAGCGTFVGNGDKVGPLWIVDATDFSELGPADDLKTRDQRRATAPALKKASQDALVATWTNPAGRAAGSLTFSPHNQQIVGDNIYLSHYHGGVYVLDASAAFSGKRERPSEVGFHVPSGPPDQTRPLLGQPMTFGVVERFFTDFPLGRPEIWDMVAYKGHILAADMTGGFYSLKLTDPERGVVAGAQCDDRTAPRLSVAARRLKLTRRGVAVSGRSTDRGCRGATAALSRQGRVARVEIAIARRVAGGCRFLLRSGRLGTTQRCARRSYLATRRSGSRWSVSKAARLPRGRNRVVVRATDAAGNVRTIGRDVRVR